MPESFDKEGHRGCRGLMPENTWPAMKTALDLGVTTLEMDVVVTRDKQVILSHEPFFNADITTKPDGSFIKPAEAHTLNIYQMDYTEVLKYDVGMKPHPRFPRQQKMSAVKPTLSDLIKSAEAYGVTIRRPAPLYNIEIKSEPAGDGIYHPMTNEFVDLVMTAIQSAGVEERVTIQSFDFRPLRYLHQKYPKMKTAMLVEDLKGKSFTDVLEELGFTPTIYSPHYSLVQLSVVKKCHEKGIKIVPWTVNDKEKIQKLKEMGVDGIITDYPDLFN